MKKETAALRATIASANRVWHGGHRLSKRECVSGRRRQDATIGGRHGSTAVSDARCRQPNGEDIVATTEELQAELERLRAENEKLKTAARRPSTIKISEKGGVSVYGLGRFPVTLYPEQWERLLGMSDEIRDFIADNRDKLKWKAEQAPE
jgi:hypothetical protein